MWALARVACPQSSISTLGVNQRIWTLSSFKIKKAVSERLFSNAIDYITSSGNHFFNGQTAAGFPLKSLLVNASTLYIKILSNYSFQKKIKEFSTRLFRIFFFKYIKNLNY